MPISCLKRFQNNEEVIKVTSVSVEPSQHLKRVLWVVLQPVLLLWLKDCCQVKAHFAAPSPSYSSSLVPRLVWNPEQLVGLYVHGIKQQLSATILAEDKLSSH